MCGLCPTRSEIALLEQLVAGRILGREDRQRRIRDVSMDCETAVIPVAQLDGSASRANRIRRLPSYELGDGNRRRHPSLDRWKRVERGCRADEKLQREEQHGHPGLKTMPN